VFFGSLTDLSRKPGPRGKNVPAAAHHPGKEHALSILRIRKLNIRKAIEHILPAQPCVLCGDMSHDGLWCGTCDRELPYLDTLHCPVCALPTPSGEICGQCLKQPPLFTNTVAVFGYSFPLDKLIQAMKYGEQLALAHAFAGKLAQVVDTVALPDFLIPMPLHPAKLRERGYNQSMLLAETIARDHDSKLLPDACRRVRDTPPQTALPWKERKKNVRNAFQCDIDLTGMSVALVDDVLTTGASMDALAYAVRQRGATGISAWVVARTLPHS
jgi:ComF family protein